jgi:hypothetical protein
MCWCNRCRTLIARAACSTVVHGSRRCSPSGILSPLWSRAPFQCRPVTAHRPVAGSCWTQPRSRLSTSTCGAGNDDGYGTRNDPITSGEAPQLRRKPPASELSVTNSDSAEASAPIIYGLALRTPPSAVDSVAAALSRYRRRVGSRWRAHGVFTEAVLTFVFLEGGHTYRNLAAGNGVPRGTCYAYVQAGIKVLAYPAAARGRWSIAGSG